MNIDHDIENFCENVRRLRREEGLTQKQMAQVMGIGIYSLRKLEAGCLPPMMGMDAIFRLHSRFGIPLRLLFEPYERKIPEDK